jgi:hypothetical protein
MRGFVERHGSSLPRDRTSFLVLESIGGPIPLVLEGEGMIRMRDYDAGLRERLAAAGDASGVPLRRGLRTGFATDGLIPMLTGYRTACLAACDELKLVPNYHSTQDTSEHLDFGTVAACAKVALRLVRDTPPAPQPSPANRARARASASARVDTSPA